MIGEKRLLLASQTEWECFHAHIKVSSSHLYLSSHGRFVTGSDVSNEQQ